MDIDFENIFYMINEKDDKMLSVINSIDNGHLIAYRIKAKKMGYKLSIDALYDDNRKKIYFETENDLRKILNIKEKIIK
jgi:hypothetical protein